MFFRESKAHNCQSFSLLGTISRIGQLDHVFIYTCQQNDACYFPPPATPPPKRWRDGGEGEICFCNISLTYCNLWVQVHFAHI